MPEENNDKMIVPEEMELEHGDSMGSSGNSEEEIRDITVDQGIELDCGDVMEKFIMPEEEACSVTIDPRIELECDEASKSSGVTGEETCDITIDQGRMQANDGDARDCGILPEGATVLVKEDGGDLGNDINFPEILNEKTSPCPENSSTVSHEKKPTAVIVDPNYKFTARSRYLSGPVSSCHDSCKFGHRHESEKKTSPTSEMIRGAQSLTRTHSHGMSRSAAKEETRKKTYIRRLSLPCSTEMKTGKLTSEAMKQRHSDVKPSSIPTPGQTSKGKTEIQPRNKVVVRNLNLLDSSSLGIKSIRTKKEPGSHSKSEKGKDKEPMSGVFSPTLLKKSPSMKARLYKNNKSSSRSSNGSSSKGGKIDGSDVPEKTLYMIEPNTDKNSARKPSRFARSGESLPNTQSSSQVSRSKRSKGGKGSANAKEEPPQCLGEDQAELDTEKTKQIGTIAEDDGSKSNKTRAKSTGEGETSTSNTSKSKSNVERAGSKPNTSRSKSTMGDGGSKPKTPRSKSTTGDGGSKPKTPRSKSTTGDSGSKPKTPRSKSTTGDGGTKPNTPKAKFGGSKPSIPKSKSSVERKMKANPEEKDGSAWKVKFKRGTVLALQVANSTPRRLLFKRRVQGDDQTSKDAIVRNKNRQHKGNETHDAKQPESSEVRLRHQETSTKKDTVDLNNVIEETASQLVKTRKSKVKALVGAFETVMSLRDRKPAVETSAS